MLWTVSRIHVDVSAVGSTSLDRLQRRPESRRSYDCSQQDMVLPADDYCIVAERRCCLEAYADWDWNTDYSTLPDSLRVKPNNASDYRINKLTD